MMRKTWIVAAAALAASCSVGQDVPAAKQAVARFHQSLNAGQFVAIYRGSTKDMKQMTSETDLVKVLEAVHRKLGDFQSAGEPGWNDQINTGGHFITLNCDSTYARGKAAEQFVYRIDGGKAQLAGYHINSNEMMIN